ncbi:MAG: VWA domain-containing protein [Ruminococcus flavefaciens]|nr:VWA domain-containing protein [Ruminococcus flavefaciens]
MKSKKSFNKRVLSAILSTVMLVNFSTLFPVTAFSEDNIKNEPATHDVYGNNGHKYRIFDTSMSWNDAETYCESLGGHLATITSAEEQTLINDSLLATGTKNTYFIGLSRKNSNSQWEWVTDETFDYSNWDEGEPNNANENYVHLYRNINNFGKWNNTYDFVYGNGDYATVNAGFICEWENNEPEVIEALSPYTLFSGNSNENFQINCWMSFLNGDVYTGSSFVSNASELFLNGKVDAVNSVIANGWRVNISEKNENAEPNDMPDWDSRIHKAAGAYEFSNEDVVKVQDRNIIDGAIKTAGNVEIYGTTFDGNCYIIADEDITYNVNNFISTGRVVIYSRNGNITINGSNIDINGILYAPKGTVAFNSNIANINGRIFADKINFSGSIFNVNGNDSDWELLGTESAITKTYTFDEDFNEGEFNGLGLDTSDELTLNQRSGNDSTISENSYKIDDTVNGIDLNVISNKSSLDADNDVVDFEFNLNGFGSQEVEENNIDLAIVVDTLGSMDGTRKSNAQNAAKEVIRQMKENDRCAIIKFSSSATVLQEFTNNFDLLESAINKLNASGGTNIAKGINSAINLFNSLEENSRQKYIILLSDGEDSTNSSAEASKAYENGIRIFALSIGNDSKQMQTVAANSNGIYLNSPTSEQINEMMQQFADEVFSIAGNDVLFEMTMSQHADIDISAINPQPTEVIENDDGSKTFKWKYEKISIDENQKITIPVSLSDLTDGLVNIADNISCTYFNRNGESSTIYANDIVMPVHSYLESGSWTTVYDSKNADTIWKNIYWNGKIYDDGKVIVKACTGNDENTFGEWIEINNHSDIENLSGRYIKLNVEMNVSSTGKTPELFDITILSDGADRIDYINNAPEVRISSTDTTCVSRRISLVSETSDDLFCSKLNFKWSCNDENANISNSDKPYTSFKFSKSGEYIVTLIVSDGNSETVVNKTITVLNDEVMVKPIIEIDVPSVVKAGAEVSGKINNLNDAQISGYEIKAGNDTVTADENGNFTFTAPENNCIIAVNAKAFNSFDIYGENSKAVIIDDIAPIVELKLDSDNIYEGDSIRISAFISDENGIKDYKVSLNGDEISLDENYGYSFIPENAGEYEIVLIAYDIADNSNTTTLKFNVSELKHHSEPEIHYIVPQMLLVGQEGEFKFTAEDENGIAELSVKANGSEVSLDENGSFRLALLETGNIVLDVHAQSNAGFDTELQFVVPVVRLDLTAEKMIYSENEPIEINLIQSDNISISSQKVTIDDKEYEIKNNSVKVDKLSVGNHIVLWQVQEECGVIFAVTLEIKVTDNTAPEISVEFSENNLYEGDSVTVEITAKDEHEIASVTAKLDGNEILVNENKVVLDNLKAGKHILEVTATDTYGNYTTFPCEFTVLNNDETDTVSPELEIFVNITDDKNIEIIAEAEDNSGNVSVYGTVNGEEIEFENGKAVYNFDGIGEYVIIIRAEDESGNYTEKTQTITISEEDLEFEFKINVNIEKNNIKPNETTNLVISTSHFLGEVTLSYTSDGGTVKSNKDGFSFVSDKTGTFEIIITALDEVGNTLSKTIYITVTEEKTDDDKEDSGGYEDKYTPEPRARVILDSNEKTETKMTEEMAELADNLGTPLAVYEYLYNNINTEFYTGSRKGAIGTYEQKGGNDVDCASLLIAMLRYLGYDAEYVTGTVNMTEQQIINLTATDDIETALKIFMIQGRDTKKSADTYYSNRTWVRTTIEGIEYDLDVSFKKYKQVENISDEIKKQNLDFDISDFKESSDFYSLISQYENSGDEQDVNVTGKKISQKKIDELPLNLPYICGIIKEQIHDILKSEVISTDKLYLGFNGKYQKSIFAPDAYISTISVGYVPNDNFYDEWDEFTPESIYDLSTNYLSQIDDAISPALYINNKNVYEWNNALTSIGKYQTLYIKIESAGVTYEQTKELIVGTVNSIVTDTQNISPQSLLTAYEKMPLTDEEQTKLNKNNVYNDKYIGNFLNLIGTTYFAQLDAEAKTLAGAKEIYVERPLSYGVFSYVPNIETGKGLVKNIELKKEGSFTVDIIGNSCSTISYNGNTDDEHNYMFAVGYVSSYLESLVLEQFTGLDSVSTAKVFSLSAMNNIDISVICSANYDEIDNLKVNLSDIQEIKEAVSEGKIVLVPNKNISVNSWKGTGYIIHDKATGEVSFKLTSGLNGGATTGSIVADYLCILFWSMIDYAGAFKLLVTTVDLLLCGNIVGMVALAAVTAVMLYAVTDYLADSMYLYIDALAGDSQAAVALENRAKFSTLTTIAGFGIGKAVEKVGGVLLKIPLVKK